MMMKIEGRAATNSFTTSSLIRMSAPMMKDSIAEANTKPIIAHSGTFMKTRMTVLSGAATMSALATDRIIAHMAIIETEFYVHGRLN